MSPFDFKILINARSGFTVKNSGRTFDASWDDDAIPVLCHWALSHWAGVDFSRKIMTKPWMDKVMSVVKRSMCRWRNSPQGGHHRERRTTAISEGEGEEAGVSGLAS